MKDKLTFDYVRSQGFKNNPTVWCLVEDSPQGNAMCLTPISCFSTSTVFEYSNFPKKNPMLIICVMESETTVKSSQVSLQIFEVCFCFLPFPVYIRNMRPAGFCSVFLFCFNCFIVIWPNLVGFSLIFQLSWFNTVQHFWRKQFKKIWSILIVLSNYSGTKTEILWPFF